MQREEVGWIEEEDRQGLEGPKEVRLPSMHEIAGRESEEGGHD